MSDFPYRKLQVVLFALGVLVWAQRLFVPPSIPKSQVLEILAEAGRSGLPLPEVLKARGIDLDEFAAAARFYRGREARLELEALLRKPPPKARTQTGS